MAWNQKRPERERRSLRGAVPRDQQPFVQQLSSPPTPDQSVSSHSFPKSPPARSDEYLAFVRTHSCCVCFAPPPSDAHHYGHGGGMGMKTGDDETVPLCRGHHAEWHAHGCIALVGEHDETVSFFIKTQRVLRSEWRGAQAGAALRLGRARGQ